MSYFVQNSENTEILTLINPVNIFKNRVSFCINLKSTYMNKFGSIRLVRFPHLVNLID